MVRPNNSELYFTFCRKCTASSADYLLSMQNIVYRQLHRVSKNVPPVACYNVDAHEWILIFFGRNVTDKVGNLKTFYYATSSNLCFCTTWQNAETRKSHISLNWIVLRTQCTCAQSSWKKKCHLRCV